MTEGLCKARLKKQGHLLSMVLNSEKLVLVCGGTVVSRSEQNVGTHVDNRPPKAMYSQVDIHRYSVANI